MIKAIDLFCGVGGLTHGLIKSGINVVAGVDLDASCKYAYTSNNKTLDKKHVKFINKSVSDVPARKLKKLIGGAEFSLLAGCAPCQPFSSLQKDKNSSASHEKWRLLYDFLSQIKAIDPDIITMENVPALMNETVFADFQKGVKDLGYFVSYSVVNAADYGVPQRRKRLIFLASKLGEIKLLEPTHLHNHISVRNAIGGMPILAAGQKDEIDPIHEARVLSETNILRIRQSIPGGTWKDWEKCLLPECFVRETGKTYGSVYGRMEWDKEAPTLTTQFNNYGTGRFGHPDQDRAISLREGAILQTFPKKYKFVKKGNPFSATVIARQIGNALPVRLGEIIGQSINKHIEMVKELQNE